MLVPERLDSLSGLTPANDETSSFNSTAERILTVVDPVKPAAENNEVYSRFSADPLLQSIPVVKNGRPVGLINRYNFIDLFAKPYQRELLGRKPCSQTMIDHPLLVDRNTSIRELSKVLTESVGSNFVNGIIVTDEGRYMGIATGQNLLQSISQIQIEDFRVAATAFESQLGMIISDHNGLIIRVNNAFTNITGYDKEEVIGKSPRLLKSERHDSNFYEEMWRRINNTGKWEGEIWNKRKNGEVYPEYLTITAVMDSKGAVTNYVASLTDITARKHAEERIRHLAFYDPLTNLPNRQLLLDRLQQALASSTRNGREGALMFIDLDNFKQINDTLGHGMGDLLLQQVARRLESCMRQADTVSRLGGDEFVVLLEDLSEHSQEAAEQIRDVGEKILANINQPYQIGGRKFNITTSIGATLFSNNMHSVDELMKQADIAMYQAKQVGRNALRFFDPKMQTDITARAMLESELKTALDEGQFQLYYQIQIDSNHRPLGAETLIRWIHPERGFVSPAQFIPLAEETNMILSIGFWVLETACAQLKAWEQDPRTSALTLSVNVSAKQFRQPDFLEQVRTVIQRHTINPHLLKLELTEGMLVENIEDVIVTMNVLSEMGVHISLDDFGTGYSSLQYLNKLPLDQLKIDRSFVNDIGLSKENIIVQTIIAMAKSLKLNVIAEGVETEEQQKLLSLYGCHNFQGYLFGKPMPVKQFDALVKQG